MPAPVLTDSLAIVVGREEVTAVDLVSGAAAWTAPRALGPSAPAAMTGGLALFLEGGGDESASASSTPSASATSPTPSGSVRPGASPSEGASPSASASPGAVATVTTTSTLVAIDLVTQERSWTVALSDVSHTGVLLMGRTAIVGTDDGRITAIDADSGEQSWSVDVGDHVLEPIAGTDDLVLASVRPEAKGSASLVALRIGDGSEAWRYQPQTAVIDFGGPSVGGELAFLVGSDASIRAVDVTDGSERWASQLYARTSGAPPAVGSDGVFVADGAGTVYDVDPATGDERWKFATNLTAIGAPIVTPDAVLQPAGDGTIVAIDATSGHQIWHLSTGDGAVVGLAATSDVVVATHTGTTPGFVALQTDPGAATTEDITSPTTADPSGLILAWIAAAVPIIAILILLGRALGSHLGAPELGADVEDIVDPWESDLEDES